MRGRFKQSLPLYSWPFIILNRLHGVWENRPVKWHHASVMASQITGNATVSSMGWYGLLRKQKNNKASKRFHVTMSSRKQQTRPQAAKATNNSGWSMSHLEMRFASSTASSNTVAYEHIILRHFFILISLTCKSSQIHVLHIYFSSVYYVEWGNSHKRSCKVFKLFAWILRRNWY